MESLLMDPLVWVGVGIIVLIIVVISFIIGRRRKQELEELDQLFTDERDYDETDKISVEKVRRTTLEREKRMQSRQKELEERKPRKVLADEDQEIITNVEIIDEESSPPSYGKRVPSRMEKHRREDTLEVNMTTKIVTIDTGNEEGTDLSENRRKYKKNLLNPMTSSGDRNQQPISPKGSPSMNKGFINKKGSQTKRR